MPQTLKRKWRGLFSWTLILLITLPMAVMAGQPVGSIASLNDFGAILLIVAIIAGATTATFIPTAVDSQLKHTITAKVFIGMTFGAFASISASIKYGLAALELLLPAYFLASIGTPVMVYSIGIAADKDTYLTIYRWIKKRFGFGESS